jgi:hypothetical protein
MAETGDLTAAHSIANLIVFGIILGMIFFGVRSVRLRKQLGYPKGTRLRLLAMELLEPPLELALIGIFLWEELTTDNTHRLVALLAVVPGLLMGRYRANESFVEALPEHRAVIVRHTKIELILLSTIVFLKVLEGGAEGGTVNFPDWFSLVLTAGLVIIVCESTARVVTIYRKYAASDDTTQSTTDPAS